MYAKDWKRIRECFFSSTITPTLTLLIPLTIVVVADYGGNPDQQRSETRLDPLA